MSVEMIEPPAENQHDNFKNSHSEKNPLLQIKAVPDTEFEKAPFPAELDQ